MLIVLALGWATLQGGRFLMPPLLPRITETLGFTPGEIGLVFTGFGLLYAVTQFPSGTYSDALSRATLILPGFLLLLVSFSVIGLSVTAGLFVLGTVLLGFGKGLYATPARALIDDLFEARQGRALGIFAAGTDLGALLASGLAVLVLATTSWQVAFVPVVALLALVTLLFLVWNEEPFELRRVPLNTGATAGRIAASREQRELVTVFAIFYFFVGGMTNFFPTLLVEGGLSETTAGGSFALLFAVGLLVKPTAGEFSDRYPRPLVGATGLTLGIAGLSLVLVANSFVVVLVGTVLVAIGYKTQFPIADAVVLEAAPDGRAGADIGAARAVFLGAAAIGPGFVGIVAELASFAVAFWLLALSLVVCVFILLRQYRRQS